MDYSAFVEIVGKLIDILGVVAIVYGVVFSTIGFLFESLKEKSVVSPYQIFRQNLGRTIIIGLELLIAGDIVRSIAVPPSFQNVGVLAVIVLIRAFLSFQIEKGTEWRIPWKRNTSSV
jgi:uncharacterized membrane protein